jgi:hypothetical protein
LNRSSEYLSTACSSCIAALVRLFNQRVVPTMYLRIAAVVLVLALGGAVAFLLTWNIPAPSGPIEKELPSDRFPT